MMKIQMKLIDFCISIQLQPKKNQLLTKENRRTFLWVEDENVLIIEVKLLENIHSVSSSLVGLDDTQTDEVDIDRDIANSSSCYESCGYKR